MQLDRIDQRLTSSQGAVGSAESGDCGAAKPLQPKVNRMLGYESRRVGRSRSLTSSEATRTMYLNEAKGCCAARLYRPKANKQQAHIGCGVGCIQRLPSIWGR